MRSKRHLIKGTSALVLFILVAVGFSACQKESPLSPHQQPPKGEGNPSLSVQLLTEEHANDYSIMVVWKVDEVDPELLLRRWDGQEKKHLLKIDSSTGAFVDEDLKPGRTYRYFLGRLENGELTPLGDVSVQVPRDLEIRGEWKLGGIVDINRLFLYPGGYILSEGRGLHIEVNEIISDKGKIFSFWPGFTAANGTDGRPGGKIFIRAKKASGELTVEGHGERGGNGIQGNDGKNGKPGERGKNVFCDWIYRAVAKDAHKTYYYKEFGKNGFPPTVYHLKLLYPFATEVSVTKIHREHHGGKKSFHPAGTLGGGGNGSDGVDGQNGGRAGDGGDSASIYVEIADASKLTLEVESRPGRGGVGAKGGKAGKKGVGGEPGLTPHDCFDHYDKSEYPQKGKDGKAGKTGLPGLSGKSGKKMPVCIKLGDKIEGNCEFFTNKEGEAK